MRVEKHVYIYSQYIMSAFIYMYIGAEVRMDESTKRKHNFQ